jgi:hypothetical protein
MAATVVAAVALFSFFFPSFPPYFIFISWKDHAISAVGCLVVCYEKKLMI